MRTVRARFVDGALEPLERLDLDEVQEFVVSGDDFGLTAGRGHFGAILQATHGTS